MGSYGSYGVTGGSHNKHRQGPTRKIPFFLWAYPPLGLYDSGESGDLWGLMIIKMVENFHRLGKYDSLSMELYMCIKRSRVFLGICVATSAVIKSKPGILCRWEFLIAYWTFLGRTCLDDRIMGSGQDREWYAFSIWKRDRLLLCSWKVEKSSCQIILAFSN